jgi:hypothetical protein
MAKMQLHHASDDYMKLQIDPGKWRSVPRWNPRRLVCWTLKNRWYYIYSLMTSKPVESLIDKDYCIYLPNKGTPLLDTAVTSNQKNLLLEAIRATEKIPEPVIEIGSYRGITTKLFASNTNRLVYAVDPFTGFGGFEKDFIIFCEAIKTWPNIWHVRKTSGEAFNDLQTLTFSFIFIDAVHDYLNTWFDFTIWGSLLKVGGLIGLHDVDDWPGTNMVCRRILLRRKDYALWGYCPNLAIFRKVALDVNT